MCLIKNVSSRPRWQLIINSWAGRGRNEFNDRHYCYQGDNLYVTNNIAAGARVVSVSKCSFKKYEKLKKSSLKKAPMKTNKDQWNVTNNHVNSFPFTKIRKGSPWSRWVFKTPKRFQQKAQLSSIQYWVEFSL